MPPAVAIGGMALAGGIAGAMGNKSSYSNTSGVNIGSATAAETYGRNLQNDSVHQLSDIINAGPGLDSAKQAYGAQNDLATMLQQYMSSGGMPNGSQINQANGFANQLFAPQQTALNQNFVQQQQQYARTAGIQGTDMSNPIFAAKMATQQANQQQLLNAQRGAFASQYAMQLPQQQLGFAQQRANVLGGLATQAMQNRQALAAMGEGIMTNERNFRLATAQRYSNGSQQSGGGFGGFLQGAIGGAGAGMSAARGFGGFGSAAPTSFNMTPQYSSLGQMGAGSSFGMGSFAGGIA